MSTFFTISESLTNINEENTTTTVKASFTERTTDTKAEDELQNEKLKSEKLCPLTVNRIISTNFVSKKKCKNR